jgi:hypothetical protein
MGKSDFRIHTFEEEIEFVQGLNHSPAKTSASTRKSKRRGSTIRKAKILPPDAEGAEEVRLHQQAG